MSCLHKIYRVLNFRENQYFKSSVACTDIWTFGLYFPLSSPSRTEIGVIPKHSFNAFKTSFRDSSSNMVYLLQIGGCSFPQLIPRAKLSGSSPTHKGIWPLGVTLSEYKKSGKGEVVIHRMKECADFYTESLLYGYCFKIFDLLRSYLLWL